MKSIKLSLIVLFLGLNSLCFSQDFLVGLQYGYGNQSFIRTSDKFVTHNYPTHRAALMLEFSPYYSLLYITTGAEYYMHDLGSELNFPLTFRVSPGKKIRPFVELGVWYNLSLTDPEDEFRNLNDLGMLVRGGLLFSLSEKIQLELGYNYNYGLITALEEDILQPLEQVDTEEYRRIFKGFTGRLTFQLY